MENLPSEKCADNITRLYKVSWDAFSMLVIRRVLKMDLLLCPGSQEKAGIPNRLSLVDWCLQASLNKAGTSFNPISSSKSK